MVDVLTGFEIRDKRGTTEHFSGTATTTPQTIPAVAGFELQTVMIDNLGNKDIYVSFDGGTNFKTVVKWGSLVKTIKGNVKQFQVKTISGTSDFDGIMDRELQ